MDASGSIRTLLWADDVGKAENVCDRYIVCYLREERFYLFRRGNVCFCRRFVEVQGFFPFAFIGKRNIDICVSAGEFFPYGGADIFFVCGEYAGAFNNRVEIAVVYRFYFDGEFYSVRFVFSSSVARHTEHGDTPFATKYFIKIFNAIIMIITL